MTRDQERQAWRAYMTAVLSASDFRDYAVDRMAVVADFLLKAEQQRFDAPDHAGNGVEIVETPAWVSAQFRPLDLSVTAPFVNTGQPPEPRPWVDLTQDEILKLAGSWVERRHHPRELSAAVDLIKLVQEMLRVKNVVTR